MATRKIRIGWLLALLLIVAPRIHAQFAPGPYQFIPVADPFIIEAWRDLNLSSAGIADWTGYQGNQWISPRAYNGHAGTDFSTQTNTRIYAIADGTVVEVVSNIPEGNHSLDPFGNHVQIAIDDPAPDGTALNVITMHLLPIAVVTVGQRVKAGDLVGYSDNTGNSTSEHCHVESRNRANASAMGPFYFGQYKYPIVNNPEGTMQVGAIIRILHDDVPVRTDRYSTSSVITHVHTGQLYFATYWKNSFYSIHLPDTVGSRAGFVSVLDAQEVSTGTVLLAMPDAVDYVYTQQLAAPIELRDTPDISAPVTDHIVYDGTRVVADTANPPWYRIATPGNAAAWKWMHVDGGSAGPRVVVYPELQNPAIDTSNIALERNFPIVENFSDAGKSFMGRPKFNRPVVKPFALPAPSGGDGMCLFLTDALNTGDGPYDSFIVGKPQWRNYFVQADVYFNYKPSQGGWERYGIVARDDGFGGVDQTFEGKGNCYALLWDSDDGYLRAARIVGSDSASPVVTDLKPSKTYMPASGWHTMRIECEENHIRYFLDGTLLLDTTDDTFVSGPAGLGYSNHTTSDPAARGAWFDNFRAGSLDPESWVLY